MTKLLRRRGCKEWKSDFHIDSKESVKPLAACFHFLDHHILIVPRACQGIHVWWSVHLINVVLCHICTFILRTTLSKYYDFFLKNLFSFFPPPLLVERNDWTLSRWDAVTEASLSLQKLRALFHSFRGCRLATHAAEAQPKFWPRSDAHSNCSAP